jgi:hypothetical protein
MRTIADTDRAIDRHIVSRWLDRLEQLGLGLRVLEAYDRARVIVLYECALVRTGEQT